MKGKAKRARRQAAGLEESHRLEVDRDRKRTEDALASNPLLNSLVQQIGTGLRPRKGVKRGDSK